MSTKTLSKLFMVLLVLVLLLLAIIIVIGAFEENESDSGDIKEITGTAQSYEVYHGNAYPKYIHIRKSERYDDKYLEYLDNKKKSRDKTFLR